jgi:hypothetical protein
MEEEYRLHKTTASIDDTSSITAMRSPTPSEIPTIRISSESTREVLPKPEVAQTGDDQGSPMALDGDEEISAFSNKRLCERWLGEY